MTHHPSLQAHFEDLAAVHRAMGDPLRLAILDALDLSDMTPSEVEARFGVPSNLLAHHLGILEAAGLIRRTRSQGDGRRRYLSLVGSTPGVQDGARSTIQAERVVFVCTRNSARSPIASALWRDIRSDIPSTSAGTHPAAAVHPLAVATARNSGLAIDHQPQGIERVSAEGDLVVTVCDEAHEEGSGVLHWSIPDPVRDGRPEAFEEALALLRERVVRLAEHTVTQVA